MKAALVTHRGAVGSPHPVRRYAHPISGVESAMRHVTATLLSTLASVVSRLPQAFACGMQRLSGPVDGGVIGITAGVSSVVSREPLACAQH